MAGFLRAVLAQQKALLEAISPAAYTHACDLTQASVGQHIRHALDHAALAVAAAASPGCGRVRYDVRRRGTDVEACPSAALRELRRIEQDLDALCDQTGTPRGAFDGAHPVDVAFMVDSQGTEQTFSSTAGRELCFGAHHAVHHNFVVALMARARRGSEAKARRARAVALSLDGAQTGEEAALSGPPPFEVPDGFGTAPSTAQFQAESP
jgi:hypothetical protein